MTMTLEELRATAGRKTVTLPISQMTFTIRRLSFLELETARLNSIMGNPQAKNIKTDNSDPMTLDKLAVYNQMSFDATKYMLGTARPRIVFCEQSGEDVPADAVDVTWLDAKDVEFLFREIERHSHLTEAADAQIEAFTKNAPSPASPIDSEGDTGDSRTKSLN